jgi:hypothetical protein
MTQPYKLIVEEPTYEVKYLVEEQNRNSPQSLFIQGPFMMANKPNRNKRIYPIEEMVREVQRYSEVMIKENRALGELNHSSQPDVNPERACHKIIHLERDGDIYHGRAKILNTPMGQLVKALILDDVKLGVSTRALGSLVEEGGYNKVSGLHLVAVDIVADPSVPTAFVNGILESKAWVLNEKNEFEPVYERFEKNISTLPLRQKEEYLKEQVLIFINSLKKLS